MSRCGSCYGTGEYQTARGWRRCPDCGGTGEATPTCENFGCFNHADGDGPYPTLCRKCGRIEHRMNMED